MPPTANAGAPPARITFASLPAAVPLDGSGSTASAGSIITWAWAIKSKPPGSTAALSATNVSNPTLNNVDIPGTYLVVLNVQQTDLSWAWDPDPASGGYENSPNTDPTARIAIEALTQYNATVPPALGERTMDAITPGDPGYMNPWEKVYELYEAANATQGELDAFTASPSFDDLYVDNIYEKTAAHTIVMKDDVTCEGSVSIAPAETLTTNNINTPLAGDLLISAGDDISIVATDVLAMGAGGAVTVTAGAGQSVTVAGGVGFPDLKTDVIGEATAAAGVTADSVLLKDGEVRTTRVYTEAVTSLTVEAFDELTLGAVSTISMITSANVIVDATSTIAVTADGLVSVDAGEGAITLDAQDSITIATSSGGAGTNDITVTAAGDVVIGATGTSTVQSAVFSGASAAVSSLAIASITEATASAGVVVEGVTFENQGADVYTMSVGTAASNLLRISGNADETAPYALTANVYGDLAVFGAAQVTGSILGDTISERTSGAGVTVEGIRLENEGSNVYAFDVGSATSTLNIMANTDTTPPGALTANVYGELNLVSTITANVYDGIVGWIAQGAETVTGTVGTTETAFTTSTITVPADWILVGSDLIVDAWFDCTGVGTGTGFICKVYWGSLASGVAINNATTIGMGTANDVRIRACINYTAIGGSPGWNSWGDLTSNANNAYIQGYSRFAQATQPTNATISLQAAVQFTGAPNGSDIITLRKLSIRQGFNEVV